MEEAPEKGKELSHSAHANGINESQFSVDTTGYKNICCCYFIILECMLLGVSQSNILT